MKAVRPRYQFFVSSTFEDLREEREAVVRAVLRSSHIPAGMEDFTSNHDRGWKVIKRSIDASDYYILVIAGKYGSTFPDDPEGLSWTHKEYRYARDERKLKVLAFIKEENSDLAERVTAFRSEVRSQHLAFLWKDADKLVALVKDAIRQQIDMDEEEDELPTGWYRGSDVNHDPNVASELARLVGERDDAVARLGRVSAADLRIVVDNERDDDGVWVWEKPRAVLVDDPDALATPANVGQVRQVEQYVDDVNRRVQLRLRLQNRGHPVGTVAVVVEPRFAKVVAHKEISDLFAPPSDRDHLPRWDSDARGSGLRLVVGDGIRRDESLPLPDVEVVLPPGAEVAEVLVSAHADQAVSMVVQLRPRFVGIDQVSRVTGYSIGRADSPSGSVVEGGLVLGDGAVLGTPIKVS